MAFNWNGIDKDDDVGFERPQKVIKWSSPSINWLFGNYGGLPEGFSAVFWGLPKGGKTICLWDAVGELHRTDPEAGVIYFDTEQRSHLQMGGATTAHIDKKRLIVKQTNDPVSIFDFIEKRVPDIIQKGTNVRMIVIDSLSGIRGVKSLNNDSIGNHLIGDSALTLGTGFKRILDVLRRYKIALLCTDQARAEMDPTQQRMHRSIKMASAFAVRHSIEFFIQVGQIEAKDGKTFNEELTDGDDNPLLLGNKIRVTMNESSAGGKGRTAVVSLSYADGFVNKGAEVANLGFNLGVITKPEGGNSLIYKTNKWRGRDALIGALESDTALREEIIADIMALNKTVL